ncbi:MAG: hypothetical protein WA364_11015 [Candidatus Nitrosopolaris sp.]
MSFPLKTLSSMIVKKAYALDQGDVGGSSDSDSGSGSGSSDSDSSGGGGSSDSDSGDKSSDNSDDNNNSDNLTTSTNNNSDSGSGSSGSKGESGSSTHSCPDGTTSAGEGMCSVTVSTPPPKSDSNHIGGPVHIISPSNTVCQTPDLKRTPWTYYSHCDVLNSDGSVSSHCEVNSKIGGASGFNSVFACQEAPDCGHYWIHADGSRVVDSDYPTCRNPAPYVPGEPHGASYATQESGRTTQVPKTTPAKPTGPRSAESSLPSWYNECVSTFKNDDDIKASDQQAQQACSDPAAKQLFDWIFNTCMPEYQSYGASEDEAWTYCKDVKKSDNIPDSFTLENKCNTKPDTCHPK